MANNNRRQRLPLYKVGNSMSCPPVSHLSLCSICLLMFWTTSVLSTVIVRGWPVALLPLRLHDPGCFFFPIFEYCGHVVYRFPMAMPRSLCDSSISLFILVMRAVTYQMWFILLMVCFCLVPEVLMKSYHVLCISRPIPTRALGCDC